MSSPARFVRQLLTAVLVSMAIAWASTAFSAPDAVGQVNPISLSPSDGPSGTSVHVEFPSCASEHGHIVQVTWDGNPISSTDEFTVPTSAASGSHPVTAECDNYAVGTGSGSFTVTTPAYDPELSLDPAKGASKTTVTATGSGFNCSYVDVVWDVRGDRTTLASTEVSAEGAFTTEFDVPADASEKTYTIRAECTHEPDTSDDADFVVTSTATDGTETDNGTTGGTDDETGGTDNGTTGGTDDETGGTDGGDTGGTDDETGGTDGGDTGGTHSGDITPVGWVVGPSAFGALLLLACLFALLNHRHRGPRWVRNHVRTTLRPGAGRAGLHEQRDAGSANRTVRLEPHTDPGDQSLG